jgi:hypothetical protein
MVKRCLLVLVFIAAHSAAAGAGGMAASRSGSRTAADDYQKWSAAAVRALIARADANSLVTAAALRYLGSAGSSKAAAPKPSALELAAHASELAPQDSSIGWLHLQMCAGTPGCDIRDAATAMRWVDADNGAAWLQPLAAAQKDRDTIEVDRILLDMAHGVRFDFYWNRIVVLMAGALDAVRKDLPGGHANSPSARLDTAVGIANVEVIPSFTPLLEACRESNSAPERREPCLRLSKTMQRGDTILAQMAGLSIEKRLVAPDSKEGRAVAERRRVLEWRLTAAAKFDGSGLPWTKSARARARLARLQRLPREEDVCLEILREHKIGVDPPEVHP